MGTRPTGQHTTCVLSPPLSSSECVGERQRSLLFAANIPSGYNSRQRRRMGRSHHSTELIQGRRRKTRGTRKNKTNKQKPNKWPGDFPKYFNLVNKIICWPLYLHFRNSFNLYICINIFYFINNSFMSYNSHIIKFTFFKYTIKWVLVYSQGYATITTI